MISTPVTENRSGYTCVAADLVHDREQILSLWKGNLGNELHHAAKYDWFYARTAAGSPLATLLCHTVSGKRVGVAAAGPRRAIWRGRSVCIGVLVDMAVIPEHRSLFPALLLQRVLQQAVPDSFAMLYGFPNPKAAPVFARAGYSRALDIRRFVRVLRPGAYLRRRMPGWVAALAGAPVNLLLAAVDRLRAPSLRGHTAQWQAAVDARFDRLWEAAPHGAGPIAVRDADFLRWRFDQKPGAGCRYLTIESSNGDLVAWFACEDDQRILVVRDFWTSGGCVAIDSTVVWLLLREARKAGYAAVSVEFGGSENIVKTFEAAGFSERSRRPFFCFLSPDAASAGDAAWYATCADEDE